MKWFRSVFMIALGIVLLTTGCTTAVNPRSNEPKANRVKQTSTQSSPSRIPPRHESGKKGIGPRLYSTGFQSNHVQVFNSRTGELLKEIDADSESIGLAVSPEGRRLYVADDSGPRNGRLRIIDTSTFETLKTVQIKNFAHLLYGNPISISGNGRWLLVDTYVSKPGKPVTFSQIVFDTQEQAFGRPSSALSKCSAGFQPPVLVGETGDKSLYAACEDGRIIALTADSLEEQWNSPAPKTSWPRLVLSNDKKKLYSFHALVDKTNRDTAQVLSTDIQLATWSAADGRLLKKELLSKKVTVPLSTVGRGEAGYLVISPDGKTLYALWEDRLWTIDPSDLSVSRELKLPAPGNGLVMDAEAGQLFIVPSSSGDLKRRGHGLWSLDLKSSKLDTSNNKWQELSGISSFFILKPPEGSRD